MIHLFKHSDGKYDIALVVRGKVIVFSNQHYERKRGAVNAIHSIMKNAGTTFMLYQDDSLPKPIVFSLGILSGSVETNKKPSKPYIPNKAKTK